MGEKTEVIIVMGPPGSGKSTYIKEHFADRTVIDLFDFQENRFTEDEIMESYIKCRDALVQAIKDGKSVVLEHTLLKRKRRPMYIKAIRSVTDAPIHVYAMNPSLEKVKSYSKKEKSSVGLYKYYLELLELPTKDEGFDEIYIIE